jgi:RNA polymerase sigma factor (sigma-70 family)
MSPDNAATPTLTNGRRAPGPHATQPRIGATMGRVASCISTTHQFLIGVSGPGEVPSTGILAEQVIVAINESERRDECEATIFTLCALAKREAELAARRAEAELGALSGSPKRRANGKLDAWVVRAMKRCGIEVSVGELGALAVMKAPAAQLGARLLAAESAAAEATNGSLRAELTAVWDGGKFQIDVADAVAQVDAVGIDGEKLCWAVITREGSRHVLLVLKEANRAARAWSDRSADSLVGYAWQGLRLALRNYDPERGMFSTYACPRIRGTIRDGIRSEHHLPKRLTTFVRKVERTREKLRHDLGRHPSMAEVATALDMDLDKLSPITRYGAPVSYDELMARPGAAEPNALIDTYDPVSIAEVHARSDAVELALLELGSGEEEAVRMLVLDGVSLTDAAERTGTSPRQLRARRDRGLAKLAELLVEWAPVSHAVA